MSTSTSEWLKPIARAGLIAKGVVYCLTGIITLLAAFNIGAANSGSADKDGIFKRVLEQPMGQVLLAIIALGLLCYAAWRIIMAIKDTENKGSDAKGWGKRAAYFFTGLVHISLAFVAGKLVLNQSSGGGNSREQLASQLMNKPFGIWLVAIVALVIIGVGIYQVYRAVSGKYKKYVNEANIDSKAKSLLIKSGKAGYIARGIVYLIVGWLFMKAAIYKNANQAGSTGEAFKWIENSAYGNILLAVVSLGLICYGIFMFLRSKYQPIHTT